MSTNKFLQKLHQQDPTLPASRQQVERVSPSPVAGEYDPIQRLTEVLSRQNKALESISTRLEQLEKRPQAATLTEVETLVQEVRQGVRITVNGKAVAELILPELLKRLLSTAGISAVLDASLAKLTAAGITATEGMERAGAVAASRIETVSRRQADAFAGRVGFTSWKAAAAVLGAFLLLLVLASLQNDQRGAEMLKAQAETQAVREFTDWIKTQPQGRKLYDRYYKP